jgi:outer membrane protein OmpA-like peptidoglycan-associated protein/tetratricopeptide (TPR) repeat protein
MKKLIFTISAILIFLSTNAQFNSEYKALYQKADDYIYLKNYVDALPLFLEMDSIVPNNANIQFHLGLCYLNSYEDKSIAIPYLTKASNDVSINYYGSYKEASAPVHTFFYLGQAYHQNYQFEKAIENLNKFIYYLTSEDKDLQEEADRYLQMCYTGKQLIENPISIKTTNLGIKINSKFPEYSPVLTPDGKKIYFTTRRGGESDLKDYTGYYYEDIYFSEYDENTQSWNEAKAIENINSNFHEATINISFDGKTLFLYKDQDGDGNIYYSDLKKDKWSDPVKMKAPVNTESYENHACLSADGTRLYLVSDRPGGFGGKDIWVVEKNKKGKWENATNLGPEINTKYNEDAPFILSDNKTLYFSSEGHQTMGGYDIFISEMDDNGKWGNPENIGSPLNTPNDDIFFFPLLDGNLAFYASDQMGGEGEKDLYSVSIRSGMEQLAVIHGFVIDTTTNMPLESIIRVRDMKNDIIATTTPNLETGEYYLSLTPGIDYIMEIESNDGEILYDTLSISMAEENVFSFNKPFHIKYADFTSLIDTINKQIHFGDRIGDRFVLKNIYFDFDKYFLREKSEEELNKVVDLMNKYPMINLEFSGHTDSVGTDQYNQVLSTNRVKSVVDYLISKDVNPDRLTFVGYGESQPIATNSTDEGRQMNRRIEFKISGINKTSNAITNNYTVQTTTKLQFYLIAGSFEMYKNADRLRIELLAKGFKNAQIIGQSSVGTFRVAYDVFDDKEEAREERLRLINQNNIEGIWILTK